LSGTRQRNPTADSALVEQRRLPEWFHPAPLSKLMSGGHFRSPTEPSVRLTARPCVSTRQLVREVCHHGAARDDPEDGHQPYPWMTDGEESVGLPTLAIHHKREHGHTDARSDKEADDSENDLDTDHAVPQSGRCAPRRSAPYGFSTKSRRMIRANEAASDSDRPNGVIRLLPP
jgi:hypothetical protein